MTAISYGRAFIELTQTARTETGKKKQGNKQKTEQKKNQRKKRKEKQVIDRNPILCPLLVFNANLHHCLTFEQMLVQQASWYMENRQCYYVANALTWNHSRIFCHNYGAGLAVIKSEDENGFVYDLLSNTRGNRSG